MKKVLAKDVDAGDYIELFGKGYHVRYINYYGKAVALKLQPEDEPLSPFYANDAVCIELDQNEEVWVGKQNKVDTSCSVGVGNGSGNLFVHGSYESVKAVQTVILEHEELRQVCSEAYQVVGILAYYLDVMDNQGVDKMLTNLSDMKMTHQGVLPFELSDTELLKLKAAEQRIERLREYLAKIKSKSSERIEVLTKELNDMTESNRNHVIALNRVKKLLAERDKLWLSPTDVMVQAAMDELRKLLTEWEQNPESWVCDFEDMNDNDLSDIAVFVLQAVASKLPKE